MDRESTSEVVDKPQVEIKVKQEPQTDEIKDYAEDTMNELLGWYGYGKLEREEAERLKLQKYTESEKKNKGETDDDDDDDDEDLDIEVDDDDDIDDDDDDDDLDIKDDDDDDDDDSDSPYTRKTHSPDKSESSVKTPIKCAWCQKPGCSKLYQLKTPSGNKTFCSEVCFTQCRRASFKRNKVCDWCKHVRHTVNYVDFQDGEQQLQFCSDKCLNQYKMNIFCKETQEHLQQIRVETKGPAKGTNNNQILITPELWMHPDSSSSDKPLDLQSKVDKNPGSPVSDSGSEDVNVDVEKTERICIRIPCDEVKVSYADSSHGDKDKGRSSQRKPCYPKQISVSPNSSSSQLSAPPSLGSLSPTVSRSSDSQSLSPGRDSAGPSHTPSIVTGMSVPIIPKQAPLTKSPITSRQETAQSPPGITVQPRPNSRPVSSAAPSAMPPHYQHPPGMIPPYPLLPPHMIPLLPPPPPFIPGAPPIPQLTPPVTVLVPVPLPLPIPIPIPIPVPVPLNFMKMFDKKEPATPESKPPTVHSRSSSSSSSMGPSNQNSEPKPKSEGYQRRERRDSSTPSNHNHLCIKEVLKENIKQECVSPDKDCIYCASCQSGQNHERVRCPAKTRPWSTPSSFTLPVTTLPSPHGSLIASVGHMDSDMEGVAIDLSTDKSKNKDSSRKISPPPLTSPHSNGSSDGALPLAPKINIAVAKHPPLTSQVTSSNNAPMPADNPYSSRRGRILDSPNAPIGKKRSPSPETHRSRGLLDYKRRCMRTRIKTK